MKTLKLTDYLSVNQWY